MVIRRKKELTKMEKRKEYGLPGMRMVKSTKRQLSKMVNMKD
jgi:hypothetical protein